jgi:hypothetical protein
MNQEQEQQSRTQPEPEDRLVAQMPLALRPAVTLDQKPPLEPVPAIHRVGLKNLASFFNIGSQRGDEAMTEGQLRIFGAIILRLRNRVQIICSTQYGKSLWVALACIVVTCIQGKRVAVIAPSDEKAKIIMRYFIEHLGDSASFYGKLEKNTRLERLRQEESKQRIMLNNGGGIFIISAQQHAALKSIEAAMGEGAQVVIVDEACLIQDRTEATIFRMIAGQGKDGFYCKIGNPFYSLPPNTHFFASWQSLAYHRIFIDYRRGLEEGRYTREFITEAMQKPLFDVLFECEFPSADVMDAEGYRPLVTVGDIKFGVTPKELLAEIERDIAAGGLKQPVKAGGDIGGGGDPNVYTVRSGKKAAIVAENKSKDTMAQVAEVKRISEIYHVEPEDFAIDDIGIGHGLRDRLIETGFDCNGVNVGESAVDQATFTNAKAELCWRLRLWALDPESRLDARDEWVQVIWLRYKTQSDRRIIMEPKEKLKARVGRSPDHAESLYLTFAEKPFVGFA